MGPYNSLSSYQRGLGLLFKEDMSLKTATRRQIEQSDRAEVKVRFVHDPSPSNCICLQKLLDALQHFLIRTAHHRQFFWKRILYTVNCKLKENRQIKWRPGTVAFCQPLSYWSNTMWPRPDLHLIWKYPWTLQSLFNYIILKPDILAPTYSNVFCYLLCLQLTKSY